VPSTLALATPIEIEYHVRKHEMNRMMAEPVAIQVARLTAAQSKADLSGALTLSSLGRLTISNTNLLWRCVRTQSPRAVIRVPEAGSCRAFVGQTVES
jgi:hypothetical protein